MQICDIIKNFFKVGLKFSANYWYQIFYTNNYISLELSKIKKFCDIIICSRWDYNLALIINIKYFFQRYISLRLNKITQFYDIIIFWKKIKPTTLGLK